MRCFWIVGINRVLEYVEKIDIPMYCLQFYSFGAGLTTSLYSLSASVEHSFKFLLCANELFF